MQSILLIAKEQNKRKEFIEKFAKEHTISEFDIQKHEPSDASFGITDVRNLQKTAYLAPYKGKEKIIVLEKAELLTAEAQNALLKILEEPPQHTYIILSTASDNSFLPTIMSRCKIIIFEQSREEASEEKKGKLQGQLQIFEQGTVADCLALAEKIAADKENLSEWLEQSILLLREQLLKNPKDERIVQLILAIQNAYKDFQTTNVSPRMILEHYFLNLLNKKMSSRT